MKTSSKELVDAFARLILTTKGEHRYFDHVASPDSAKASSLVFLQKATDLPMQAAVIVTTPQVAQEIEGASCFVACVQEVRLAQALIKQRFDDYLSADSEWDERHPTAVIHASARLGENCRIGPGAVVGANCVLGNNVTVRAGAVVEHNVSIGDDSIISPLANIGYGSSLGKRVIVQAGAVIASEGFGFAPDSDKHYHRIPHTGSVVIGDDVFIGANSCIDRGTYGVTTLERGVKIDNQVHLAHNVEIGEDTLLAAQTVIAGSTKLGKRVIASGQAGILDHINVTDDVILVQRCGVTQDIERSGMWAGTPAKPFKEYVRDLTVCKRVAKLEQQIKDLKKLIDER